MNSAPCSNVSALLEAARRNEPQRDPKQAAVSDLFSCDRATWYRRNDYPVPPHSAATLRKFSVGKAVEAEHVKILREAGTPVVTGLRVALRVAPMVGEGLLCSRTISDDVVPERDEVTGHPDFMFQDPDECGVLVEVKTTDVRKPEAECKPHYKLQAAAYALALNADAAVVHVTHVANFDKDEMEYSIDFEALRPRVIERIEQVLERTRPGAPIPEPEPPMESAAFACKYCPWAQCERNQNKDAVVVTRGDEVFV